MSAAAKLSAAAPLKAGDIVTTNEPHLKGRTFEVTNPDDGEGCVWVGYDLPAVVGRDFRILAYKVIKVEP